MLVIADNNPIRHIRRPWVNYTLIGFCILIFLINPPYQHYGFTPANLALAGDPGTALGWNTVLLQSVSYIFLHGDLLHLAGNMVVLRVFGSSIEDSMGHARYPLFFILCGMAGALAEGVMSADPHVPVVGASGAIAGVMGAYLLQHPRARVLVLLAFRVPVLVPASVFVGLGIALDLISALVPAPESEVMIAWWAHIGGFAAGVLLILVMRHRDVPLFQPATAYPDSFKRLRWLMIDLAPRPGADQTETTLGRQVLFGLKSLAFFVIIVVIIETIFA